MSTITLITKVQPADDQGNNKGQSYTNIAAPSTFEWGKEDISDSKAGRTAAYSMKKMLRGKARTLTLSWRGRAYSEMATTLAAFDHEYAWITYRDALTNTDQTKLFYMGGMTANSFTATKGGIWEVVTVQCIQAKPDLV